MADILFTFIHQVAKLCFVEADEATVPTPLIYSLLSSVKAHCTQDHLEKAIDAAFQDLAEIEEQRKTRRQDVEDIKGDVYKPTCTTLCRGSYHSIADTHARMYEHTYNLQKNCKQCTVHKHAHALL